MFVFMGCRCCRTVETTCCDNAVNRTLYVTLSNLTGDCACYNGTYEVVYDNSGGFDRWYWTGTLCGRPGTLYAHCSFTSDGKLRWNINMDFPCASGNYSPLSSGGEPTSNDLLHTCVPVHGEGTLSVGEGQCIDPCEEFPPSPAPPVQTINWSVDE